MKTIRPAKEKDLARIAEIEIFNYRLKFYPIFQDDSFYFDELQVPKRMEHFKALLDRIWVYDDGVVKGFIQEEEHEVKKLFVEPILQGQSIGGELLDFAIARDDIRFLWALEKNEKAIKFYQKHGFRVTGDTKLEEDTTEYLIRLELEAISEENQ